MYGGLFGDLPSAKKQKQTPPASSSANKDAKHTDSNETKNPNGSAKDSADVKTVSEPAKGNWFAPPRQAAAKPKPNSSNSQFLQTVGKSGTTMAFVPTAALKSKRKKTTVPTTTNTNNKSTDNNSIKTTGETAKTILSNASGANQQSSFASVATTTTTTRIAASKSDKSIPAMVVDIHGTGTMESNQAESIGNASSLPESSEITEEEKITDPYDPFVPNDLLEYWETLAAKKHREKMERDTLEALEKQKALRKQLEEDRKALLQTTMASDAPLQSMGRGRGVSNLPAWLVEKQRANESGNLGADEAKEAPSFRGRGRGVSNLPAWLVEKQRKEASGGQ